MDELNPPAANADTYAMFVPGAPLEGGQLPRTKVVLTTGRCF